MTILRVLPVSVEQPLFQTGAAREIEQRAAAQLPPHTLMRRAGEAVAALALAVAPRAQRVWLAAGPGNNGGDALEAALRLRERGHDVEVSLLGEPVQRPADASAALARAQAAGVCITTQPMPTVPPALAIDGLLGAGSNRAPEGSVSAAIEAINALHAGGCPVLAIDMPSGLNADTGQRFGQHAVQATHTLALLALRPGLYTATGRDQAGEIWFDALGVDPGPTQPDAWLSGVSAARGLPPRRHAQHKGSFGDVAVVAGAAGMSGAALLAARAAHAAGAGRVFVDLLDVSSGAPTVDSLHPETMFRPGWSNGAHDVLARSTVVSGCGGGDAVRAVLPALLRHAGRLVLDADALNAVSTEPPFERALRARAARGLATVLTPHPLEAARLLGCAASDIQADRLHAAARLVQRYACVVVLKGSGSIVVAPSETPRINGTGNASLASAGTGDVLAGWLAGRWAQFAPGDEASAAFRAARLGVAEHGAAAEPPSAHGVRASDLIERLHRS